MATNITRQVAASVYFNSRLADKIIDLLKNPYNAIVKGAGIDELTLLKHALNARHKEQVFHWWLFLPSVIFILSSFVFFQPVIAIIIFLGILTATIVRDKTAKNFIKQNFLKENFNTDFQYTGPEKKLVDQLEKKTCKNAVYYSGYSPFVGSGYEYGGWSFVVDIDKGKSEMGSVATPKAFLEDELYYRVSQDLLNLKIPNFSVENKVYFNGRNLRANKEILPDIFGNPVIEVSPEFIKKAMNSAFEDTRFYKMVQVVGWDGDLVVTAFLRVQKGEKTLFVENNYFVLPPIKDEYRAIDRIKKESGINYFFKWLLIMLAAAFAEVFVSILHVSAYLSEAISKILGTTPEAKLKKVVKSTPIRLWFCNFDKRICKPNPLPPAFSKTGYRAVLQNN